MTRVAARRVDELDRTCTTGGDRRGFDFVATRAVVVVRALAPARARVRVGVVDRVDPAAGGVRRAALVGPDER